MPMIQDPDNAEERDAIVSTSYAGFKEDDPANITHFMRAVRNKQWKLIIDDDNGEITQQLFNLQDDPANTQMSRISTPRWSACFRAKYDAWAVNAEDQKKLFMQKQYTDPAFRRTALQKLFAKFKLPPKPIPKDCPSPHKLQAHRRPNTQH